MKIGGMIDKKMKSAHGAVVTIEHESDFSRHRLAISEVMKFWIQGTR
jgi:hypothetical protein